MPWFFWIASGFGLGLLPAPGTMGSFLAFPIALSMQGLGYVWFAVVLFVVSMLLINCSILSYRLLGKCDHKSIISDEILGMLLVLLFFPVSWENYFILFLLFRFYDIFKPGFIRQIDAASYGGYEVVLDDLIAGLYAVITYHFLYIFINYVVVVT